jgi:hypothetical protein
LRARAAGGCPAIGGLPRVRVERCHGLDAAGLVDQVMHAVAEHVSGYHSNDTSIMVLQVFPH